MRSDGVHLKVHGICKAFGQGDVRHVVLQDFSMEVFEKTVVSIFGPNGCGKSTLVNIIAGIIAPDEGTVEYGFGEAEKAVGIVFQSYEKSLLPWRSCLDNIAFPLENGGGLSKSERREVARSLLSELGLTLPLKHYPYELSGGQKQLACIARAMIRRPSILLLDEPFASLDYQTRITMQEKLQTIWGKTQITTILVSHEIDEAVLMADRLFLLTSRPARVARTFEITLPRPRAVGMVGSPTFADLRSEILDSFQRDLSA